MKAQKFEYFWFCKYYQLLTRLTRQAQIIMTIILPDSPIHSFFLASGLMANYLFLIWIFDGLFSEVENIQIIIEMKRAIITFTRTTMFNTIY